MGSAETPSSATSPVFAGPQLLLTKLYLPPARADLVQRPRLLEQLSAGVVGAVTLVCGPAGFGKTSLFSAWRAEATGASYHLAWLSLDSDDDDPERFLQYLVAALEMALPGVFGQAAMLFRLPQLPPMKTVLATILNGLVGWAAGDGADRLVPLVLAFDDYHVLSNPTIHEAVEYLLDHMPPCLHVVILSRSDPALRLARLKARGQLTEILADDLRFTTDEAGQFLNEVMRLGLPARDVAVLDARTEGWIAALKLAALRLAQPGLGKQDAARFIQSFDTNHRFVAEFLIEEVISRQPPAIQAFLLRSSILERLCAPLCDELLEVDRGSGASAPGSSSEEAIEYLVRSNLFIIPLDEEGYWYRYHHLFRDLLRARLSRLQSVPATSLHQVAAQWFENEGLLKEGVRHAILTQDWGYAADMVERHGVATLGHSDLRSLDEWCAAFPEEVIRRRPVLCILQAWVLVLSYRDADVPAINARLMQAEQALAHPDLPLRSPLAPGKAPVPVRAWVLGNITQLRASHMLWPSHGDFDARRLVDLSRQSMELLAEAGDGVTDSVNALNFTYAHLAMGDAKAAEAAVIEARHRTLAGHNYYGGVTAMFYQAYLAYCQGKLDRVEQICTEGRATLNGLLGDPEQSLPAIRSLDVALACARLERDDLAGAEQAFVRALDLFGWAPWVEVVAYIALARLRAFQGDPQGALSAVATLERLGPHVLFCTRGLRVLAKLRTSAHDADSLAEASSWAQSIRLDLSNGIPMGMAPFHSVVAYATYHAWAHVMVILGEARAALTFAEPGEAFAQEQGLMTRVIELSLVEALAHNVLGESRRSWVALERALAAAEPLGHLRTFDLGEPLKRLLAQAAARGVRRRQIQGILDAIGWPEEHSEVAYERVPGVQAPEPASRTPPARMIEALSEREQEILELIAAGLSNAEIAAKLFIGIGTVKTHVNHLFGKLEVSSRTQLIARARMLRLIS